MPNGLSDFLLSFDDSIDRNKNIKEDKKVDKENDNKSIESNIKIVKKEEPTKKKEEIPIKKDISPLKEENINKKEDIELELEKQKEERRRFLQKIEQTGTNREHFNAWIETYKKGLKSTKNNKTVNKIKNGRFRIKDNGNLEILPDFKVETLDIKDVFKSNWI